MNLLDAHREILRLKATLDASIHELTFDVSMHFPDLFFREVWNKEIPAPGISARSGVYLVLDAQNKVLYVGKATTNNLGAEIYNRKFKKVTSSDPVRFDNSELAEFAPNPQLAEILRAGSVKLAAFVIDPPEFSSLVEVFLHTLCWRRWGRLPPLNKRIG